MPYTRLYSVHPYWWKRQVSHQLWPSGSQHASKKECRWDIHSGFETHEEGHMKSKTGAISGSTRWTLVQRKKKSLLDRYNLHVKHTSSEHTLGTYGVFTPDRTRDWEWDWNNGGQKVFLVQVQCECFHIISYHLFVPGPCSDQDSINLLLEDIVQIIPEMLHLFASKWKWWSINWGFQISIT